MLYRFKSRATGDLLMLEPNARRLLQIMGQYAEDGKGILLPEQMPTAIAALQAAIASEEAEEAPPDPDKVSLRQRAAPFIEMLRRCHAADKEIVWGV